MIQGVNRSSSEQAYRAVMLDSSSSIKDFSLDRKKYYRKYILSEDVEEDEKENQATKMGKIAETLLMEPDLFDEKFYMSACAAPPTGLMLEFVEGLYKASKEATDNEGNISAPFDELAKEAYIYSGFKLPIATILNKFIGSDAEIFYDEIRRVRAKKMVVVTTQDVTYGERIVETLKLSPVTKDIVNLVTSSRYTVQNQLQIEGFSVEGHLLKGMLDKVIFDHQEKTIQVYDLKCVWAVENFYEEYYLYRRAYIQALVYYFAAKYLTETNKALKDYTVNFPMFIICDSTNYYSPLVYTLDEQDMKDAMEGFEHKGRKYPGVKEIIQNLHWALENNIWAISRENYLNKGIVLIQSKK